MGQLRIGEGDPRDEVAVEPDRQAEQRVADDQARPGSSADWVKRGAPATSPIA